VTRLPPFEIERYFAVHEFAVPYLLCASDVEPLSLRELLAYAGDDTRALWDGLVLGYTETLGLPLLRQEIAGLYDTIEAEDVIGVVGASEALFILMSALVRPGDHVLALWPAYQSLYDLARAQGADVELVELRPDDGWALDLDRVAAALRPSTRAVVVNLPHNPTGMHVGAEEFDALVDLVDGHGATLVCDEVYRGLEHDPAARLPAAADRSTRAVSVGVLSKSYALAGLRVGWLATRDRDLLAAAAQVRDYTTLCSPAPSEVLGVVALRAADALLERSRGIIAANLAILDELFAAHRGRIEWVRPRAGSIGFPRYLGEEGIDAFSDRLVREQGVLLLPGRVYDYGSGHFRIGFGRTNLPEAVQRLDRQLRA
jgi:aspartate/methionine/tyrosine aminotransferase